MSTCSNKQALIDGLTNAGDDWPRIVAVLWTWLAANAQKYGALAAKAPELRRRAITTPKFKGLSAEHLAAIDERPLEAAASLLAQIDITLRSHPRWPPTQTIGFDDEPVLVQLRGPLLAEIIRAAAKHALVGNELGTPAPTIPPGAQEHPTPLALAPSLSVCPLKVGDVRLELVSEAESVALIAMRQQLNQTRVPVIHLAPLGTGMIAPRMVARSADGEAGVAWFDTQLEGDDGDARRHAVGVSEEATSEALAMAVERARGQADILVMPELALSPARLSELCDLLAACNDGPALVAVGLHHEVVEPVPESDAEADLVGKSTLATRVNEAVLLGPYGRVLARHRKLTSAAGDDFVEDIRPGTSITLVPTPLGSLALLTCMDAFAIELRARLATCGAEILLVPSLSPTVHRHRIALQDLVQKLDAVAFVCNRWFGGAIVSPEPRSDWNDADNRSFYVVSRHQSGPLQADGDGSSPLFVIPQETAHTLASSIAQV